MDKGKNLTTKVTKETKEFTQSFTKKYIQDCVKNKLQDYLTDTIRESYENANKGDTEKTEPKKEEPKSADDDSKDGKEMVKDEEQQDEEQQKEIVKAQKSEEPKDDEKQQEKTEEPKSTDEPQKSEEPEKEQAKTEEPKSIDDDSKEIVKDEAQKNEEPKSAVDNSKEIVKDEKSKDDEKDKPQQNEESKDDEKEQLNDLKLPLLNIAITGFQKHLFDGAGHEHNEFDIVYYKMSFNKDNPSRFGKTLKRYSKLREFHLSIIKILKINKDKKLLSLLKFPSKNYAFWKNDDDKFLKERQNELSVYFNNFNQYKKLKNMKEFQVFIGLMDDPKRINDLKIFRSSLKSVCSSSDYLIPTDYQLNRFNLENDMLCFSLMLTIKARNHETINEIIAKVPDKLKNKSRKKVIQGCAENVRQIINVSWTAIKITKDKIETELDKLLKSDKNKFDDAVNGLCTKIVPIINKKLNKKKENDDDDNKTKDDKDEEVNTDLKVEGMKGLNEFITSLADAKDKSYSDLFKEYINSPKIVVLASNNNRHKISSYLWNIFESSYGKYIKYIIKDYAKYEKHAKLICDSTAEMIQISFKLINENLGLIFAAFDKKTKDKDELIQLLSDIAKSIANIIGDEQSKISSILQAVNTDSSSVILQETAILTGLIGNLLTNLVYDYYKNVDDEYNIQKSLSDHLNVYLHLFCKELIDRLYKSILSLLLAMVKAEISDDIDQLFGDKLNFDFLPSALPDSVPQDILENVIYIIIKFFLTKNMKSKFKTLQKEYYQIIRDN